VPAAALAGSELSLDLTGGTDVPWSPTFDYLALVVRSAYEATGISFEVEAAKRGYFPKGGGRVKAHVRPSASVRNIILGPVSNAASVDLVSRCGMLPRSVAERQLASMERVFEASGTGVKTRTVSVEQADSPGTSALAWTSGGGRCLGGDAIGARGKPAEAVGAEAANRTLAALQTAAPVDENLADMILPLLSLADGPSSVAVPSFTEHLKTSLHVAALFTGCRFRLVDGAGVRTVEVAPSPRHNA
jgi:RNA 3'-phosphate cyclase